MASEIMKKILSQVADVEKDELEEYGTINPTYDSTLSDMIIVEWTDLFSPWEWIKSSPELLKAFVTMFDINKKVISCIKLYRGTDDMEYLTLKKDDVLNYSERYSSWSSNIDISLNFTDPGCPILFIYEGPIVSFNLAKTNSSEAEHIVEPQKFIVNRILSLQGSEDIKMQRDIVQNTINGTLPIGSTDEIGKIFFLKPMD
jgi:hypothetical protein